MTHGSGGFSGDGNGQGYQGDGDGAAHFDPRQRVQQFAEEAGAQVEHARMLFEDMNDRFLQFVRERPGTSLIGAVAVGYLIGKLARVSR